LQVQLEAR
ncbi:hypothetical protein BN1708_018873, partial [Verticillium longisporum]